MRFGILVAAALMWCSFLPGLRADDTVQKTSPSTSESDLRPIEAFDPSSRGGRIPPPPTLAAPLGTTKPNEPTPASPDKGMPRVESFIPFTHRGRLPPPTFGTPLEWTKSQPPTPAPQVLVLITSDKISVLSSPGELEVRRASLPDDAVIVKCMHFDVEKYAEGMSRVTCSGVSETTFRDVRAKAATLLYEKGNILLEGSVHDTSLNYQKDETYVSVKAKEISINLAAGTVDAGDGIKIQLKSPVGSQLR